MELFCKIFINSTLGDNQFINWLSRQISAEKEFGVVKTSTLHIDIMHNEDFDPVKLQQEDKFLYYPIYVEVEPIGNDEKQFIEEVGILLQVIWDGGADAVAACDFEDKLPSKVVS